MHLGLRTVVLSPSGYLYIRLVRIHRAQIADSTNVPYERTELAVPADDEAFVDGLLVVPDVKDELPTEDTFVRVVSPTELDAMLET